jgi:hypothetical protein
MPASRPARGAQNFPALTTLKFAPAGARARSPAFGTEAAARLAGFAF